MTGRFTAWRRRAIASSSSRGRRWSRSGPAVAERSAVPVAGGTPKVVAPHAVFGIQPEGAGGVAWLEEPDPVFVNADGTQAEVALQGWVEEGARGEGGSWFFRDDRGGVV